LSRFLGCFSGDKLQATTFITRFPRKCSTVSLLSLFRLSISLQCFYPNKHMAHWSDAVPNGSVHAIYRNINEKKKKNNRLAVEVASLERLIKRSVNQAID
ncbi:hypothetical protein, partial [Yersinia pestis]|uniref:hypothetical protein n=2 Tax=Yersinia pestis TaxID=632 RepID=UPI001BB313B4